MPRGLPTALRWPWPPNTARSLDRGIRGRRELDQGRGAPAAYKRPTVWLPIHTAPFHAQIKLAVSRDCRDGPRRIPARKSPSIPALAAVGPSSGSKGCFAGLTTRCDGNPRTERLGCVRSMKSRRRWQSEYPAPSPDCSTSVPAFAGVTTSLIWVRSPKRTGPGSP
jgi:hypothetical protein